MIEGMWIAARRYRANDFRPDLGPHICVLPIVNFLARENRRSTKCLIASFDRTLVVISDFLCPRVAREWRLSLRFLGGSGVPARPRGWAEYLPSIRPLEGQAA